MWKSVTGQRPGGSAGATAAAPGSELASVGLLSQDSPLLGLLSAVSRPAVSFLQRWSPFMSPRGVQRDFVEQEAKFLQTLDAPQLHALPWFNLSELGIQTPEDAGLHSQTVLGHVLIHSPRGVSKTWLDGLWSGADEEQLKSTSGGLFGEKRATAFVQERAEKLSPLSPALGPALLHSLGLAPDLDNGYSSLEEEQLLAAKAQLWSEEEAARSEEDVPELKCDNKAIAFIMGCPCSDDSDSEDDEDDDDGFDSDCSSDVSDSDEFDSEAERLWSALCQSDDPYSPRNFTAKLGSAPRPIPRPGPEPGPVPSSPAASLSSSAASSVASSVASSASSPSSVSSSSSWDEASETEAEHESLKLLGAFSSSDPYSPLNFQAPIRTKPGPDTRPDPEPKPDPEPQRGPEERDRKISESSQSCSRATSKKQVRFRLEVQVFSVGCEERRGPWEELARDRARFAKRCCETELVLSPCLQLEHRRRVYCRISQSEGREAAAGQSEGREAAAGQSEGREAAAGQSEGREAAAGQSEGREAAAGQSEGREAAAGQSED